MKVKASKALLLTATLLFGGCEMTEPPKQKTSLEIQSIQSRTFESNLDIAFAATLSVFQDLGYIVQSADKSTGFITAKSATKMKSDFWSMMNGVTTSTNTSATAFIEMLNSGKTKVRLNFVVNNSSSTETGQNYQQDQIIEDPKVYQNAFDKIGDGIFVRQGFNPDSQ